MAQVLIFVRQCFFFSLFDQNLLVAYQIRFPAKKKTLKIKLIVGKFQILKGVYIKKLKKFESLVYHNTGQKDVK